VDWTDFHQAQDKKKKENRNPQILAYVSIPHYDDLMPDDETLPFYL